MTSYRLQRVSTVACQLSHNSSYPSTNSLFPLLLQHSMDQNNNHPLLPPSPPDFGLIAREVHKCTQLPVFDQGAAIMHALTQINDSK